MKKHSFFVLIPLGIFIGILAFISPLTLLISVIIFIIGFILWKMRLPREERSFLIKLFIASVLVRLFICILIYFISVSKGGEGSLFQDDVGWPRTAWLLYQSWLGKFDINKFQEISALRGHPADLNEHYLLSVAFLFSVIKYYTPLVARFLNIIFGSLIVVIVYYLAGEIFTNRKIARLSAVSVAFFPSLILWSIAAVKDIYYIFFIITSIWLYTKWVRKRRWGHLILIIPVLFSIYSIRKMPALLLIAILLVLFPLYLKISRLRKVLIFCLMFFSCIFIFYFKFKMLPLEIAPRFINVLWNSHKGYWMTGGNVYMIMDEHVYPYSALNWDLLDISKALFTGMFYFMLAPFPWHGKNFWQVLSIPQMILWYFILPISFLGILLTLRYKFKIILPVLFFVIAMLFVFSLSEGNIGTAVRHREVLTPFLLLFSSVGIVKLIEGRIE